MSVFDTLLLVALPASGKSELRRYLEHLDPDRARDELHLGPIVQLDDYPYVRLMSLIDAEAARLTGGRIFFTEERGLMRQPGDWATLAVLLAEDHARLGDPPPMPARPLEHLLDRIERARRKAGVQAGLPGDATLHRRLAERLDGEAAALHEATATEQAAYGAGSSTVIVEFARGGPRGASLPLAVPHGYGFTLPFLGPALLEDAAIVYVWVSPEDSRKRNEERRASSSGEAAVIDHRVPDVVMENDYGTDDLLWLAEQGGGRVVVEAGERTLELPVAIFDNRADYTTFLRGDPAGWAPARVRALHNRLIDLFDELDAMR